MIQDAARNWVACRRGGGLSDPLDLRPWCSKSVSSASPTSKVVGSYVSTLLGSARASYEVLHRNIFPLPAALLGLAAASAGAGLVAADGCAGVGGRAESIAPVPRLSLAGLAADKKSGPC